MIGPVSLSGRSRANRPHIAAHIPPCALLHHQLSPVPGVGCRDGAQAAPVALLSLRFSHGAPGGFRTVLAKLTSLGQHHHVLSAFHHKRDVGGKKTRDPEMVRAVKTQAVFFSMYDCVYVCVVEVGGGE